MNSRNNVAAIAIAVALFCVVRVGVLEYRVAELEQRTTATHDWPVARFAWWFFTGSSFPTNPFSK